MNDSTKVEAKELANEGLRVFPCRPNDKRPAVSEWPDVATSSHSKIDILFHHPDSNVAIRCGQTAGGYDIFVVDIDIKNGQPGEESWANFCADHPEVAEAAAATVSVSTPSGGWHFYFAVPDTSPCPRNRSPWPGVDIRGEGGYVVAPPSRLPDGSYTWVRDLWEPNEGILFAPPALLDALLADPPRSEPLAALSVADLELARPIPSLSDDSPIEWAKANFSVYDFLLRLGWQPGKRRGHQEEMTRPGKSGREGTSATFHHDSNIVNVHTTTIPAEFANIGSPTRNGGFTINGFDGFMIENGFRVQAEAMSHIRKQLMPAREPVSERRTGDSQGSNLRLSDTGSTGQVAPAAMQQPPAGLNLPDEFWESRGWLAHIRQAAWHRQMSADSILGAVITRYAAAIPTNYRIPAIIMAESTFDHISVLVAESSGGKSAAMSVSRELFPGPQQRKDIVWDYPTPSGEGLVDAFFEMAPEADSKKLVNKKVKSAVHFSVDEALGLVEASGRQGATIGSVLCTAWSGGNPGQGNASAERKRVGMNPWTYRMSGLAAIQSSLGYRLLEDTFVEQGLSGRLVFFAAEDPEVIHWKDRPEWPGPLDFPVHPTVDTTISYDRAIEEEILEQNWLKQTKRVRIAPIDGHLNLVKLKLSGIFALMEGRKNVTPSDWDLAGIVVDSHLAIRNAMLEIKKQSVYDRTVSAATAQAHFEATKDDVKERQAISSLRDTIIRHVPEEGITRGPLRKATVSSKTKYRFDTALAKAIEDGKLVERDGRYFRG